MIALSETLVGSLPWVGVKRSSSYERYGENWYDCFVAEPPQHSATVLPKTQGAGL